MDAAALLSFLRRHRLAVEASIAADGGAQAAVVGVAFSDQFEIVFDTIDSSRKAQNLRRNPRTALVIGGSAAGDERTAQYEGLADEPSGPALERLKEIYYEVYPDGRDRLAWPGLIYVRVRPTWIRYSDYGVNPPLIVEFGGEQLAGCRDAVISGPWEIRRAGPADAAAIADAHRDSIRSLGPASYPPQAVADWQEGIGPALYAGAMGRGEVFFIAVGSAGGAPSVLGFASDYPIDGSIHGVSAYVRGGAAGRGLGSALLARAEALAIERGATELRIEASFTGLEFYRRHGFVEVGRGSVILTTGKPLGCVFMRKQLTRDYTA